MTLANTDARSQRQHRPRRRRRRLLRCRRRRRRTHRRRRRRRRLRRRRRRRRVLDRSRDRGAPLTPPARRAKAVPVLRHLRWHPLALRPAPPASANAKLRRFMSWTDEPGSEQVDCFAARSWGSSTCPTCGQRHIETGWYFPPWGIVEQCVKRAMSDGARGLFLVPTNYKAPSGY